MSLLVGFILSDSSHLQKKLCPVLSHSCNNPCSLLGDPVGAFSSSLLPASPRARVEGSSVCTSVPPPLAVQLNAVSVPFLPRIVLLSPLQGQRELCRPLAPRAAGRPIFVSQIYRNHFISAVHWNHFSPKSHMISSWFSVRTRTSWSRSCVP